MKTIKNILDNAKEVLTIEEISPDSVFLCIQCGSVEALYLASIISIGVIILLYFGNICAMFNQIFDHLQAASWDAIRQCRHIIIIICIDICTIFFQPVKRFQIINRASAQSRQCKIVIPPISLTLTSAPCSTSNRTISNLPFPAAIFKTV